MKLHKKSRIPSPLTKWTWSHNIATLNLHL